MILTLKGLGINTTTRLTAVHPSILRGLPVTVRLLRLRSLSTTHVPLLLGAGAADLVVVGLLLASGFHLFIHARIAMLDIFYLSFLSVAVWHFAAAIRQPGGEQAVQLKVAERAVEAFGKVAADATTTLIVPGNMSEVSALIASAMRMVQAGGRTAP